MSLKCAIEEYRRLSPKIFNSGMLNVGIHALTNGHEYHCVAIRMRCWLMDA
jgi:hypothetical protein